MMEEGNEALGFESEIYWLSEQAEMWLDGIGHTVTRAGPRRQVARTIAAPEDIERRQAPSAAPSQPAGREIIQLGSQPRRSNVVPQPRGRCARVVPSLGSLGIEVEDALQLAEQNRRLTVRGD